VIATISQIKKAELVHRANEEGVEKISYAVYNTDRSSAMEDYAIGESLLDLTIGQLKHEGLQVSDEHADFDIWPCCNGLTNEEYTLIVVSIATTDEGRKSMIDALDIC
jgi:hypothetical protein